MRNLQVCRMVIASLYKRRIQPLPFAANMDQLMQVTGALYNKGLTPAIFVVNTFRADELVREVDRFIGDTPMLLLRREIYSFNLIHKKGLRETSRLLNELRPRLTAMCGFGSQNSHLVAERVSQALYFFLNEGDFQHVEGLSNRLAISAGEV
ncbi:MAG: hypothetical protein NTW87_10305 [Planctomycetota bacterium]|nr:hypothetical protein [Planctomycetota bacterium]